MANDDIIDLPTTDDLLNQRLQSLLNNPKAFDAFKNLPTVYSTQDDEISRALEVEKLAEYGYGPDQYRQKRNIASNQPWSLLEGKPRLTYEDPRLTYEDLITADQNLYSSAVARGVKAGDPYFFQRKILDRLQPRDLGEMFQIDYENNLPFGFLHDYSNLPPSIINTPTQNSKETIERLLREKFNNAYAKEGQEFPPDYDFDVQSDPSGTVGFTFQNPYLDGKRSAVNPPGLQFMEAVPFVSQLALEIGAGIAGTTGGTAIGATGGPGGAIAGGITGGIVAEGTAAFLYKYSVLNNLQERGIIAEDYPILKDAMKEAGIIMGIGGSVNTMLAILSRGKFKIPGGGVLDPGLKGGRDRGAGTLPFGIDEDEFIKAFEYVSKNIEDTNLISVSNLTAPQVVKAYAEIQAAQGGPKLVSPFEAGQKELEKAATSIEGSNIRIKLEDQKELGERAVDDIFETGADLNKIDAFQEGSDIAMSRTGTQVRDATLDYTESAPNVIIAKNNMDDFIKRNSDEFTKFLDGGIDVSPSTITRNIQEDFYNLRMARQKESDEAFDLAFNSIKDKRKKPFDMTEVAEVFEGIIKQSKDQIFPPGELIGIAKRAINKIKGTDKIKGQKFQSRESFDADLEELRGILFDAYQNPQRNRKLISELEKVIDTYDATRYKTLVEQGGEGSTKLLDDALDKYKVLTNQYKSGLIGDITRLSNNVVNSLSADSLSASNRLLKFINSGSTITDDGVISSPKYLSEIFLDPNNAKLVDDVRLAGKNNLFENVFDIKDGKIIPKENGEELLRVWKNNNASLLDPSNGIFSKQELDSFANVDQLVRRYNKDLEAENLFLQKAKNSVDIDVITKDNLDQPEIWFSQIFEPNNVTKPSKLFEIVKAADNQSGGTQLMDKVKLAMYDDFMKKTSTKQLGTDVFDANKMGQYISEHGAAMGVFLGDDFVEGLTKLQRQLKVLLPAEGQGFGEGVKLPLYKAAQSVLRAYVGLFTRPGRFLTAANQLIGSRGSKKQLDIMNDPKLLYDALMVQRGLDDPIANMVRRDVGYLLGEYIYHPGDLVGELTGAAQGRSNEDRIEMLKDDLQYQMEKSIEKDLDELNFQPNSQVSGGPPSSGNMKRSIMPLKYDF
jgi:hypothetical protein|tara:strand:+ start:11938 stop:15303 length:3366 start_codon:yes stop_codon:yes gene_type:complete